MQNKQIELLVRAIIKTKGKILVCKRKGKDYYFLPGGHIEYGESARYALKRELQEELGIEVLELNFIGALEHTFTEDRKHHHEINIAFDVKTDKIETESKESHLQFFLLTPKQFRQETILPASIKKSLLQWFRDKEIFWRGEL